MFLEVILIFMPKLLMMHDGRTLVSASSCDPGLKDKLKSGGNVEAAKMVGQSNCGTEQSYTY